MSPVPTIQQASGGDTLVNPENLPSPLQISREREAASLPLQRESHRKCSHEKNV